MLGVSTDERVFVLGVAFRPQKVRPNQNGIDTDKDIKLNDPGFGLDTAKLLGLIERLLNPSDGKPQRFNQLAHWLDQASTNWYLIDKHSADLTVHRNLKEMDASKKVQAKLNELWGALEARLVNEDELQLASNRIELEKIFFDKNESGAYLKLERMLQQNRDSKNDQFEKCVRRPFDDWKRQAEI